MGSPTLPAACHIKRLSRQIKTTGADVFPRRVYERYWGEKQLTITYIAGLRGLITAVSALLPCRWFEVSRERFWNGRAAQCHSPTRRHCQHPNQSVFSTMIRYFSSTPDAKETPEVLLFSFLPFFHLFFLNVNVWVLKDGLSLPCNFRYKKRFPMRFCLVSFLFFFFFSVCQR